MEIVYTDTPKSDLIRWRQINNKQILKRIKILILAIHSNPFRGIGKPELLKNKLKGYWSRRINKNIGLYIELQKKLYILTPYLDIIFNQKYK